jgi:hypothetical protein
MSTILDHAEARIAPAALAAQTRQREIIEAMREECGLKHYTEAREQLPKLDHVIATESRPFLDQLTRISQQKNAPLPPSVSAWVRELADACFSGTRWTREGIDEWERLTPPCVPGTQQLDMLRRAVEIDSLRRKLMNWNGKLSRLRELKASIEQYILESNWPAPQPGVITIAPAAARGGEEVPVVTDFLKGPRL